MKRAHRVIDWSGGICNLPRPDLIPPNTSPLLYDVQIDRTGRLLVRPGGWVLGGGGEAGDGLCPFFRPRQAPLFLGVWGGRLYRSTLNYSWDQIASDASLVAGLHTGVQGRAADGSPRLYIGSVEPAPSDGSYYYSQLLVADPYGACTQVSLVRPGALAFWQGRLWAADFAQDDLGHDTIAWSKLWDGGDWSGYLAQNLRIDPGAGGRITALIPARAGDPVMYVLKERAVYLFTVAWAEDGWIPAGADDLDLTKSSIRLLSRGIGCVAPLSATWVPAAEGADVYFLAHDGVRSLRRTQEDAAAGVGGPPLTVGLPDVIERINWAWAHRASAAVHDNYYMCALPLDGAVHNSHILLKNLRVAPDAGWALWRLPARALAATDRLFFQLAGPTLAVVPPATEPTLAAHVYRLDPACTPAPAEVRTRAFDCGVPDMRKQWRWLEFKYQVTDTGLTLTVEYDRDIEDDWRSLTSFYLQPYGAAITLPAPLPWDFMSERIQKVRYGLEEIDPAFNLAFRFSTGGGGTFRLHEIEVVGDVLTKEWA